MSARREKPRRVSTNDYSREEPACRKVEKPRWVVLPVAMWLAAAAGSAADRPRFGGTSDWLAVPFLPLTGSDFRTTDRARIAAPNPDIGNKFLYSFCLISYKLAAEIGAGSALN